MYNILEIHSFRRLSVERQREILVDINLHLSTMKASERVSWALSHIKGHQALTSSFGIQAAVCLHMYTVIKKDIPVILIDTGYLFPETYKFIEELKSKLNLNLKIYRSSISPAWQESLYGKLWEQGIDGITKYNRINKVLPMVEALKELDLSIWHSGLRREQSESRKNLEYLSIQGDQFKFLPILDWSDTDVENYLKENNLDYHPLYFKGYVSMGDIHTTTPLLDGMKPEDTRFYGQKRECGLHDDELIKNSNLTVDMSKFFKKC